MSGLPPVRRWWHRRSQVERFELLTRWSLYVLAFLAPFMILTLFVPNTAPAIAWSTLGASLVQCGLGVAVIRSVLAARRHGGPIPVRALVVMGVATLVGIGLASSRLAGAESPAWVAVPFLVMGFVGVLALVRRTAYAVLAAFAGLAVPIAVDLAASERMPGEAIAVGVYTTLLGASAAVVGYRSALWMLDVVWELDRARETRVRLAVAEERLRFSRDLHDVVGRGLSVVALKSDLAAQLAKRGHPEAAQEMLAVRQVANDLLAEVRDVVRGYRRIDLSAELAGARSVLDAAGIDCRIIGEGGNLDEQTQATLGWVVREGTTNVLRHSDARTCTIALRPEPGAVVLTMSNDGARPEGPLALGHGLLGLTERLAAAGGDLRATREPGSLFTLTARVPS